VCSGDLELKKIKKKKKKKKKTPPNTSKTPENWAGGCNNW